jgi:hypothetical protein
MGKMKEVPSLDEAPKRGRGRPRKASLPTPSMDMGILATSSYMTIPLRVDMGVMKELFKSAVREVLEEVKYPMSSHATLCHLMSSHITPMQPHAISCNPMHLMQPYAISCNPMQPHVTPCNPMSSHALMSSHATPCNLMPSHVISCNPMQPHATLCHLMQPHITPMSSHVISYHPYVISCNPMPSHAISCHLMQPHHPMQPYVISCNLMSSHATSCRPMSSKQYVMFCVGA